MNFFPTPDASVLAQNAAMDGRTDGQTEGDE